MGSPEVNLLHLQCGVEDTAAIFTRLETHFLSFLIESSGADSLHQIRIALIFGTTMSCCSVFALLKREATFF